MHSQGERLLILWKWLLSFTKKDWQLDDYPVQVRRNDVPDPAMGWVAGILQWPGPVGLGATPAEAKARLRKHLAEIVEYRRNTGNPVPRPGAYEPVRFAPTVRVAANPELLDDFIEHVLGFPAGSPVFISDGSSLHDFGPEEEVERLRGLVRSRYRVETADMPEASIADILERIAAQRAGREG